jgi:hypothetical protein
MSNIEQAVVSTYANVIQSLVVRGENGVWRIALF